MSNWLEQLKPGDKVIVSGLGTFGSKAVCIVERLTTTQIILCGISTRYRRNSGDEVGGDIWNRSYLMEATPHAIQEIREKTERNKAIRAIESASFKTLSTDQLVRIVAILKEQAE